MQLHYITAALASLMVTSAIAGPIPQPLDMDALDAEEALALYARAEQVDQAQQAQAAQLAAQHEQTQQGAQVDQAKQGEQGKQGDQWYPGGYYNGRVGFNGFGINANVAYRGYGGYPLLYGGYGNRIYTGRRGYLGGYRGGYRNYGCYGYGCAW